MLIRKQRPCPECEQGLIETREVHEGSHCSYCHKLIEVDFTYSAGIPVLLALLVGLSFSNDLDGPGYLLTALLVCFTAGYRNIVCSVIPLKHYG